MLHLMEMVANCAALAEFRLLFALLAYRNTNMIGGILSLYT